MIPYQDYAKQALGRNNGSQSGPGPNGAGQSDSVTNTVMSQPDHVREELEKAASLVTAARRLLVKGTMVDLSALEGKVRFVCSSLEDMDRKLGRPLVPAMEALITDLDRLGQAIHERAEPLAGQIGPE